MNVVWIIATNKRNSTWKLINNFIPANIRIVLKCQSRPTINLIKSSTWYRCVDVRSNKCFSNKKVIPRSPELAAFSSTFLIEPAGNFLSSALNINQHHITLCSITTSKISNSFVDEFLHLHKRTLKWFRFYIWVNFSRSNLFLRQAESVLRYVRLFMRNKKILYFPSSLI